MKILGIFLSTKCMHTAKNCFDEQVVGFRGIGTYGLCFKRGRVAYVGIGGEHPPMKV